MCSSSKQCLESVLVFIHLRVHFEFVAVTMHCTGYLQRAGLDYTQENQEIRVWNRCECTGEEESSYSKITQAKGMFNG